MIKTRSESNNKAKKTNMIDMTSTFPYFLVRNSGEEEAEEEVPSIIVPSADGTYYKVVARWLAFTWVKW